MLLGNFRNSMYFYSIIQYRLESVLDGTRTDNPVNSKSWFHFSVEGFPRNTKGKFTINKVQTLTSVFNVNVSKRSSPSTIKAIDPSSEFRAKTGKSSKHKLNYT